MISKQWNTKYVLALKQLLNDIKYVLYTYNHTINWYPILYIEYTMIIYDITYRFVKSNVLEQLSHALALGWTVMLVLLSLKLQVKRVNRNRNRVYVNQTSPLLETKERNAQVHLSQQTYN